jgi:hypothetical protein
VRAREHGKRAGDALSQCVRRAYFDLIYDDFLRRVYYGKRGYAKVFAAAHRAIRYNERLLSTSSNRLSVQ